MGWEWLRPRPLSNHIYARYRCPPIHLLHPPQPMPGVISIQSLSLSAGISFPEEQGLYYSLGLHPWELPSLGDDALEMLEYHLDREPRIIALGEAGLDRRCDTDFALQVHLFEEQIKISERRQLPLIIHLVGAQDELLRLHKKYSPRSPWVIHGEASPVVPAHC